MRGERLGRFDFRGGAESQVPRAYYDGPKAQMPGVFEPPEGN